MTDFAAERPRSRGMRILEIAAVVVFALLVWQNYTLRRQQSRAAAASKLARGFVPKDVLQTIPVVAPDGSRSTLDLTRARTIIAVVDPRCESCRELIATLRPSPDLAVISVAPPAETRQLASLNARMPGQPLTPAVAAQFKIYPQLFVVDRGNVVRTCANVEECR
ncbi:MAG TPA: hypothetical protein VEK11_17945 [Thermoanaerobaculia bacterium]|jgi:hypothetical protein|nr:hypothetical protein [Thermoanaerobaculia bacterium]